VATYDAAKSSFSSLAFDYTVALTDTSVAALAATAMNLPTGAGIVDSGGNALAAQSLTGLAQSGPRIQPLLPVITGVTESPASGHLGVGASDTLTLTTNEPVTVTGTPTLALNDGGTATYDALESTSTSLAFDYTVAPTDHTGPSLAATTIDLPTGASIVDAAAYSGHGEIATAVPFNSPGEMADFGVWLAPGRHGLARASGLIGSGAGWSAAAYLGPWGICFEVSRGGITSGSCVPTTSILGTGEMAWTGGSPGVAGGTLSASAAWVIVNQADGTRTKVWPVTVGGQKFFAFQTSGGTKPPSWTAYDSSGAVVGSSPR